MFYTYTQNNSGGGFDVDEDNGIDHYVIVEAGSAVEANRRSKEIGLYFDDNYAIDCECCGPRWSQAWSDDKGTESPEVYCKPVTAHPEGNVVVHYADGQRGRGTFEGNFSLNWR